MNDVYDVAILGAGPGGYVTALRTAQLGARVALIERERVGGTCLNVGCIPTKALTTSADLLVKARQAAEFGVRIPTAEPDLPALMVYKQTAVDNLVNGVEQLLKKRKVTLVQGDGRLIRRVLGYNGHAVKYRKTTDAVAKGGYKEISFR